MAFILLIKSLLQVLLPAGIRLAMAGTADEEGQRMNENDQRVAEQTPNEALRVGFAPLVDSAPLVMAQENPYETQSIKASFSVAT
jgi:hypothetical protein